jgi:hypothetical protein
MSMPVVLLIQNCILLVMIINIEIKGLIEAVAVVVVVVIVTIIVVIIVTARGRRARGRFENFGTGFHQR